MAHIGIGREAQERGGRWIEWLARVGFVAKGLLYATVGALAACAGGMGGGGETTDTRGAMTSLLGMPFGRVVLIGMAVGLVGYALWRIAEGIWDPDDRGSDAKAVAVRASFVARGLAHLALAVTAFKLARVMPAGSGSSRGNEPQEATAMAFELPAGQWLVMAVALGIAGFGLYQVYRAVRSKLSRQVDKQDAEREVGGWIVSVSRIGIAARGLVFVAVGWMLAQAALQHDASEAGGVDRALDVFRDAGRVPLVAIGLGLVAYAMYQFLCARYRRIRVT
jgi:hypothetical protein